MFLKSFIILIPWKTCINCLHLIGGKTQYLALIPIKAYEFETKKIYYNLIYWKLNFKINCLPLILKAKAWLMVLNGKKLGLASFKEK